MAGFQKAKRENIWVKVLNIGSSGGGKTYSSLRVGTGFAEEMSKKTGEECRVAFIGSEARRGLYYANEFDFDYMEIKAPFEPEKYVDALDEAIDAGYKVVVLDSLTHEWSGKGGCLEIHSKIPGNSYTAWQKVTPRHDKFMDKIIDSPIHIFATVRGKDKYVLEEVNGKSIPKKVPLGYQQRDDIEYLFTCSFVLDKDSHVAESVKDNTHIFENNNDVLTQKHGVVLYNWANSGDVDSKKKELDAQKEQAKLKIKQNEETEAKKMAEELEKKRKKDLKSKPSLDDLKADVLAKCQELSKKGKRDDVVATISKFNNNDANPSNIGNIDVATNVLEELNKL